jgi:flagellar biosynthesis protein FlhB
MFSLTFRFKFRKECLKAFMLHKLIFFIALNTVRALLKRTMVACMLNLLDIFFGYSETIEAFCVGSMIAMTLFDFFFSKWSLVL